MLKRDVLHFFGGAVPTAKALRVSHQAVYKWPAKLPESTAKKVRRKVKRFLQKIGE